MEPESVNDTNYCWYSSDCPKMFGEHFRGTGRRKIDTILTTKILTSEIIMKRFLET